MVSFLSVRIHYNNRTREIDSRASQNWSQKPFPAAKQKRDTGGVLCYNVSLLQELLA
jgi:hypothetical protein